MAHRIKSNKDRLTGAYNAYKGLDMNKIASRPGSLDVLAQPSRIAQTLFYPNGTILKDAK